MKLEIKDSPKWLDEYFPRLEDLFEKYFDEMLKDNTVGINFVSKEKIHELNREYRKMDSDTDVLSFPYVFIDSPGLADKDTELGDVFLCAEVINRYAKRDGVDEKRLMLDTLIHGVLHIIGYDHKGYQDDPRPGDEEMFDMQATLLEEVAEGL